MIDANISVEGNLFMVDLPVDFVRIASGDELLEVLRENGIDIRKHYEKVQLHLQFKVRFVQVRDVFEVKPAPVKEEFSSEGLVDFSRMKKDDLIAECVKLGLSADMDLLSFTKANLIDLIVSYKDVPSATE